MLQLEEMMLSKDKWSSWNINYLFTIRLTLVTKFYAVRIILDFIHRSISHKVKQILLRLILFFYHQTKCGKLRFLTVVNGNDYRLVSIRCLCLMWKWISDILNSKVTDIWLVELSSDLFWYYDINLYYCNVLWLHSVVMLMLIKIC